MELAAWRCLPEQGQLIHIPLYQRLSDRMYVGDDYNDTADWWYKTSDPQGAVRDVTGAYMRVLDHRGIFRRPAGQNSKYKMANDTPYDGMSIGAYLGDAIRNIHGWITFLHDSTANRRVVYTAGGAFYLENQAYSPVTDISLQQNSGGTSFDSVRLDAFTIVPIALENRPASISAYLCIKY
jgi:hypothetical protein